MAETPLVRESTDPFIKAVKETIANLEVSQGPLYGAVLLRLHEMTSNDWILLVGSKKLLRRRLDGIHAIADALKTRIPKADSTRIRRVDVIRPDDQLYHYLSRTFQVEPGTDVMLRNCNVDGLEIEEAVLFAMNPKHVPPKTSFRAENGRRPKSLRRSKD